MTAEAAGPDAVPTAFPPGPKGRGLRHLRERLADDAGFLMRLHAAHGGFVSLDMAVMKLCVAFDPELIQQILVTRRGSFEKGPAYKRSNTLSTPTMLTGDGVEHRRRRKLAQPAFHRRALVGYAEQMIEEAAALQRDWADGKVVDVLAEMQRVTLGIAAAAFFGRDAHVGTGVVKAALDGLFWGFKLTVLPFGRLLVKLPLPRNLRARRAFAALDAVIYRIIGKARDESAERTDLISLLVRAKDEEDGHRPLDDLEVRDEAYIILMAGHETTATGLTWSFHHLGRNPAVRERLEREVDAVLGGRTPRLEDVERLPYTQAVLDEALRLCPPIYLLGRRATEDCVIGDYLIPKGTVVQVCLLPAQHDAGHFPEPERFRPERWLEPAAAGRPKFAYFPFGGGDRICIGGAFARMEMTLILASVVQRWRLEAVSRAPVEIESGVTYAPRGGLPMRLVARDQASPRSPATRSPASDAMS